MFETKFNGETIMETVTDISKIDLFNIWIGLISNYYIEKRVLPWEILIMSVTSKYWNDLFVFF